MRDKGRIIGGSVGFAIGLLIVAAITGVAFGWITAHTGRSVDISALTLWMLTPLAVIAMAGSMVISVLWMRSIDEAAREAHKAAWFWGGCGGMAAGGVALIVSSSPAAARWSIPVLWDGRTDPAAYAAAGAFGMIALMVAGYTLVWVWWWLSRGRG